MQITYENYGDGCVKVIADCPESTTTTIIKAESEEKWLATKAEFEKIFRTTHIKLCDKCKGLN